MSLGRCQPGVILISNKDERGGEAERHPELCSAETSSWTLYDPESPISLLPNSTLSENLQKKRLQKAQFCILGRNGGSSPETASSPSLCLKGSALDHTGACGGYAISSHLQAM